MMPTKTKSLPLVVTPTRDLKKASGCPIMRVVRSDHFAYEMRLMGLCLLAAVLVAIAIKYM